MTIPLPSGPTPPKVRWDHADPRPHYANVFRLAADRGEIVLSFGSKQGRNPETGDLTMALSDDVVLSPPTAKRLLTVLNHALRSYEWKYGSLGGDPLPPVEPLRAGGFSRTWPAPLMAGLPEQGSRLLETLKGLDVPGVLERSFKMFRHTLLTNRILVGFKRDSLSLQAADKLRDLCVRLKMPGGFLEAFYEQIAEANILFFGFEENEQGSRYKAYLEFGDRLARAKAERPESPEPVLIYLGFKWDPEDPSRASLARYTCRPSLSVADMLERIAGTFYEHRQDTPLRITREILELASKRASHEKFLYIETEEDNTPRSSFDLNLYNARLRLEEVYPWLLELCRHYAISPETFHAAYAPVRALPFGHLTGGVDRHGQDFLSVYFGG